ncbi:hypothetical protein IHO40_01390 [Wolbachia endosymbiont of Mansonella ozzardi]|uniref:hypothetical protein n=1 Tax=Wolbachia endosymbiont of Mansonella ozzardi TaxID=137464 RepID=UPI001CE1B448|nr:hypothetical protein [Wolbachia endosymbiont of Mansonella ozzardi]MCA4774815.1 hypothetical protein [Wolbachia endosymbiont of Mansonella ozzardi]
MLITREFRGLQRKISSGWNSVKNWWSGNKVSQVSNIDPPKNETPEESDISANEPDFAKSEPVIGSICKNQKGVLELFVETNHTDKNFGSDLGIVDNVSLNPTEIDELKYRAYIKCEKGIFKITCDELIKDNNSRDNGTFLGIESIASRDGKDLSNELEGMKNMLGLSNNHTVVSITQTSKGPIIVPKTVEDGTY